MTSPLALRNCAVGDDRSTMPSSRSRATLAVISNGSPRPVDFQVADFEADFILLVEKSKPENGAGRQEDAKTQKQQACADPACSGFRLPVAGRKSGGALLIFLFIGHVQRP